MPCEYILKLETEIHFSWPEIMDTLSPARYIDLLDSVPNFTAYHKIPDPLAILCQKLQLEHGMQAIETIHKLVLAHLISQFKSRLSGKQIPSRVINLYRHEHERILSEMSSNPAGFYSLANDLFLKDLGLARTLLIPVGIDFIQLVRGVPRSVIWRAGFRQSFSSLCFFLGRLKGFGPFFEIHMDVRNRAKFTPEARESCFRTVAEMLTANKDVKGLLAGSWLHDPALEAISPRLGYLRREAVKNGGKAFYYADEDGNSGALMCSASRRRLFAQGLYQPKNYFVVWPREGLMKWATMPKRLCTDGA